MSKLHKVRAFGRELECFPLLRMYWFKNHRIRTTGYHVTPYTQEILNSGYIYPPQTSNVETLGSPYKGTISFSAKKSDARELARSLALYALLHKGLMSVSKFKSWIMSNFDTKFKYDLDMPMQEGYIEGILKRSNLSEGQLFDGSWVDPYFERQETKLTTSRFYRMQGLIQLFDDLKHLVGFVDPAIFSDAWVDNLPNTQEALLRSIGIFKCNLSAKTLVDPSLGYICYGGYYGTGNTKGAELLGLDWEDLWSNQYGTGESIGNIGYDYWKILDILNNIQGLDPSTILKSTDEVFSSYRTPLPYDFSEYGKLVGEVPVAYCQDALLYFCQESEFALFSNGIPVTQYNLCVSGAQL